MRSGTDVSENSLRHLLNEWDPIGVADEVQDEYDCMLAPLLQRLRSGADQAETGELRVGAGHPTHRLSLRLVSGALPG